MMLDFTFKQRVEIISPEDLTAPAAPEGFYYIGNAKHNGEYYQLATDKYVLIDDPYGRLRWYPALYEEEGCNLLVSFDITHGSGFCADVKSAVEYLKDFCLLEVNTPNGKIMMWMNDKTFNELGCRLVPKMVD